MQVHLASIYLGPSLLPVPEYLFPSLGLVNFQPLFLKIHFLSPFLFFHLPKSLLYVGWHVFIAFVTILLLFYVLVFWPWVLWDLSSPTSPSSLKPHTAFEGQVLTTGPPGKSLVCFILFHVSLILLSFFSFEFLSAVMVGWFTFYLPGHIFVLYYSFCYSLPLAKFHLCK